jgi:hypothetical protein
MSGSSVDDAHGHGISPVMVDGNEPLALIEGSQLQSPLTPLEPTATSLLQLRSVVDTYRSSDALVYSGRGQVNYRAPQDLRLPPILEQLGCDFLDELNDAARRGNDMLAEPVLVSPLGTVISGVGRWRFAVEQGTAELACIEYSCTEEEAVEIMLSHYQTRRAWNPFIRARVALSLKPHYQKQALANMRSGGRHKGLANLPNLQRIDVRERLATLAGVSPRTLGNVEDLLRVAHPRLIHCLNVGKLSINKALHLSKFPKINQPDRLVDFLNDRDQGRIIRQATRVDKQGPPPSLDEALALIKDAAKNPGSVLVRRSRSSRSVVILGQHQPSLPNFQSESRPK